MLGSDPEIVKLLLGAGADVDTRTGERTLGDGLPESFLDGTMLMLAAYNGGWIKFNMLMNRVPDVREVDAHARTVLYWAIKSSSATRLRMVKELILVGADVNPTAVDSTTLLMHSLGDLELVNLLLRSGADPLARNRQGKTAEELAEQLAEPEVAARLKEFVENMSDDDDSDYYPPSSEPTSPTSEPTSPMSVGQPEVPEYIDLTTDDH